MQKNIMAAITVMALMAVLAGPAGATLTTIGQAQYGSGSYNLIWDNDSPIGGSLVWLDYTNSYNTWQNQKNWAAGLGAALTYNINPAYSVTWGGNWRLPSTVDRAWVYGYNGSTTAGYNITSSEMGHLYYTELGNKGYYDTSGNPQSGWGLTNNGEFANLLPYWYWFDTEYASNPVWAWAFTTETGSQNTDYKVDDILAIAVRPGQVSSASAVPEPSTMLLLGAGLAGLVLYRRRLGH